MDTAAEQKLVDAIRAELARWLADAPGTDASAINRGEGAYGCCSDFVSTVYERLGGVREAYHLGLSEIGVDQFMTHDEDDEPVAFDETLLTKHWPSVQPPANMTWPDASAMARACDFSAGTHEWITLGQRHYDAECPEGVDNFWDLPFFQRVVTSYVEEFPQPGMGG